MNVPAGQPAHAEAPVALLNRPVAQLMQLALLPAPADLRERVSSLLAQGKIDAGEAAADEPRRLERPHVPVAQPPKAAAAPRVDVAVALSADARTVLAATLEVGRLAVAIPSLFRHHSAPLPRHDSRGDARDLLS